MQNGDEYSTEQALRADCLALVDLPEVDENSQINYPTLPQQGTQHVAQVPRSTDVTRRSSGQPAKSPGGTSTFSGTTARISGSGQELSATSAEDMMDALKDLSDASSKILGLLVPREVSEASVHNIQGQLSDLKSRGTRQLQRHIPNFEAQRNVYGGDRFINAPASVRAVLKVSKLQDVRSGPWRMDPILYQANLATLLTVFLAQSGENIEHATNELDKVFPRPFLQLFVDKTAVGGVADGSALLSETFQVAVELRTYFFIDCAKRLHHTQGFDPDEVLTQVFYNHNDTLRGWNVAELRSEEINKNRTFKTTIIDRLDHLRETFSDEAPLIDLESLERSFPRFRLTTAVTWWSQLRVREVELQLRRLEGAVGIVRAIQSTGTGDGQMSLGTSDIDARRIALNYEQPSDTSQLDSDRLQAPKDKDAAKEAVLSKPYT